MIDQSWYVRPASIVGERLTAGGVVVRFQSGEPLVALAREGGYEAPVLPKGGVEPGEDLEQAARREIEEETGLSRLALIVKLGLLERLSFDKRLWLTTHVFLFVTCWARRCYKVMLMSGVGRAEIHGFYEALGFDKKSKQAFVITAR